MSDLYNRNPFSGGREQVEASQAPAQSPAPIPSAPAAPPAYQDYTRAAVEAAQASRAGNPLPAGATDYTKLALASSQQYKDQRLANLEVFSYMTSVSDMEYSIIRGRLTDIANAGGDVVGASYKIAAAVEMSRFFGRSMESVMENFDSNMRAWTGRDFSPTKTNFLAVADSFRIGSLNIELGKTARAWMDSGGADQALEKKLDDLSTQIARYQDNTPRPWIINALKAGAESAPFTLRAAGMGILAAGGAALAIGSGGTLAPAAIATLKAGASMMGSFMESADTMRGLEYYEMRKNGITHEVSQAAANLSGSLQAAVEAILGNVPGLSQLAGAPASVASKVASNMAIKGGWGAVARAAMQYGGEALEEGLEEAIQQTISDSIQNTVKEDFGISVKNAGAMARDAWESAKGGFTASLVMGLPSSVVGGIKTAKTAKALKEYAGTTDRETFIERAGAWEELAVLPEDTRRETLSKVWEQAQKKAKESREKEAQSGAAEAKPFERTEAGTLYTEEETVSTSEEGKVEAVLKVGDAESKERLGYLRYEVTDEAIILKDGQFEEGYESVQDEAVLELAAKYPGMPIIAESGAEGSIQESVERLAKQNPRGTGANWYADTDDQDTARARARMRLVIAEKMPKVTPVQREAAIMLHEFRANAQGVAFSDYLKTEFTPQIIGEKGDRVSAAQGQRAGILFTDSAGQELKIGEFVKDAKALIMTTERSDFVSFVHESGHLFRKQLIGTDLGGQLEQAYEISGGTWTREHEEHFVDDLVKYLSYGEAKDERLASVFQKIAQWITRLWNRVIGQADVDPRIRAVMDELFKSEKSPLSEAARTEAIAEDGKATSEATALALEGKEGTIDNEGEALDDATLYQEDGRPVERIAFKFPKALVGYSDIHSQAQLGGVLTSFGRGVMDETGQDIRIGAVGASHISLAQGMTDAKRFYFGYSKEKKTVYVVAKNGMDESLIRNSKALQMILSNVFDKYRLSTVKGQRLQFADDNVLYQYVGEKAELDEIEKTNLAVAREMAAAGKDAETVRMATGWFKGKYDGKWRLETNQVQPKDFEHMTWGEKEDIKAGNTLTFTLPALLDDPELYKKYPFLEGVFVHLSSNAAGGASYESGNIAVGYDRKSREINADTLHHEIQHLIQREEGFARGGSPEEFKARYHQLYKELKDINLELRAAAKEKRIDDYAALIEKRAPISAELQKLQGSSGIVGYDQYYALAGEIEARDVASRMSLTPEQRKALPPYSSEAIGNNDAIVLYQLDEKTIEQLESMERVQVKADKVPSDTHEAARWIRSTMDGMGRVRNEDSGREIEIVKRAGRKISAHMANHEVVQIVSSLPEIIRRAVFINREENIKPEQKTRLASARHYAAFIELDGKERLVTIATMVYQGIEYFDQLKNWQVEKKEAAADRLNESGATASSEGLAYGNSEYRASPHPNRIVQLIRGVKPDFLFETEDPVLYQMDEEATAEEALTFDSWESWRDYVEGFAIPAFGEDTRAPQHLSQDELDVWYRERWESAKSDTEQKLHDQRQGQRKEARRGEFAARMAKEGGVEELLMELWTAQVRAYDRTAAMDETEQEELEKAHGWRQELSRRLADHPLVLLAAQSVGQGKKLKSSTRKAILTYVRNNETEFAALYAELTGDLDLAQYAESSREKLQAIPAPELERYADMSIAERTALLNRITDAEVRKRIRDGEIDDPELADYVRRLEEDKKKYEKENTEAAEEIKKLEGDLEAETDYAHSLYERNKATGKALKATEEELTKAQAAKERVSSAREAYADALSSARDEAALSVRLARKELTAALREARTEAAFQTRIIASEIRAAYKLRQQIDSLRRAIMKRPSKAIKFENRQQIETIQEYLRAKKWEYIEEMDEEGKRHRRRAYDTVVGADGKTYKVPRYSTTQIEKLKSAFSILFRESPELGKILTNDIVDRINDKPVSAWSIAELKELKKIIDNLAKLGRAEQLLKENALAFEREVARRKVNATIRKTKFYKEPFGHGSSEQKELMKNMEKRSVLDLPFLNMRRFSQTYLDGGKDGPNAELLVWEERDRYNAKVKEIDRRLKKVFMRMNELKIGEKDFQEKVTLAGVGPGDTDYTITKGDLMAIRLMLRDEDAKAAFIFGNLFSEQERNTWNAETLKFHGNRKLNLIFDAVNSDLTTEMKEIGDMIGDDFDKEFDRLNVAVIDLTNQEMKKVRNYYPIHREGVYFDKFGDKILDELKTKYGMMNLPDSGFTLERIKIGMAHQTPVKLDLFGTWQKAVERQEHLVSYGSYLKKLNAVYKSRRAGSVREAILQSFGKSGMDYVDQYISEVANPHEFKGPEEGDRAVRLLRGNMAVGFLAYRWTSVMKQIITSPLPYMAYAPKGMAGAAFQMLKSGNPMKFLEEIEGMSEMLKHRTADQIFETIKNMNREGFEGAVRKIGDIGMKGLEFADRFSVAIGWKGVYDEALAKGSSHEEAVRTADDITLKTQPSARGVDLAPVFRGNNEWKRLLLQFGSALNVIYQNIRYDMPQAWRDKEYGRSIGIAVSYAIAGILLGAFGKAIGRDKPDDDEAWYRDWVYYSMTQFSDSVPLVGNEVTGFLKRWIAGDKRRFGDSELLPAVESLFSGIDNLFEGDILKAAEELGTGLGLGIGLPTLAMKEYIEFLLSLLGGEGEEP